MEKNDILQCDKIRVVFNRFIHNGSWANVSPLFRATVNFRINLSGLSVVEKFVCKMKGWRIHKGIENGVFRLRMASDSSISIQDRSFSALALAQFPNGATKRQKETLLSAAQKFDLQSVAEIESLPIKKR